MVTMLDVANHAGVSKATVSRVLNGTGQVKSSTRQAVFQAMEELGYRPNLLAQSLAHNRSHTVGLVISHFDGPYFGTLLRQAAKSVEQHRRHLIVTDGHDSATGELAAVNLLIDRRCDAILLYSRALADTALYELLHQCQIPLIILNRHLPDAREHCVFFEQQQAAYQATSYLLQQGHRQLACINGPLHTATAQLRLQGFHQALAKQQLHIDAQNQVSGDNSVAGGYQACRQLLQQGAIFSALFCNNDDMARGAMKALREAGKKIPEDISLFGFDDEPGAAYLEPALSTVSLPVSEMISAAVEQAMRLTEGLTIQPIASFHGTLCLRESVALFPPQV